MAHYDKIIPFIIQCHMKQDKSRYKIQKYNLDVRGVAFITT